ncbi:S2-RNase [Pyrus ussuriensis x Pyrus communis]|uniref:S2-RNase n=1 Tax=Pyrus ussuriensis x Pyrus communis TaxID=2448454 RepID=A0A5N5H5C9_9ROSA|nr:S2-RNase [Pyrus ussuriensis x Pyrus communis]
MQRGTSLSNAEAESSLIVRLSTAMSCSSSDSVSVSTSNSDSKLELGGLNSSYFHFFLKVHSKLLLNSNIFSRIG